MSGIIDERIRWLEKSIANGQEALQAVLDQIKAAGISCAEKGELAIETTKALAKALYQANKDMSQRIQRYNTHLEEALQELEQMVLTHHQEELKQNKRSQALQESILIHAMEDILGEEDTKELVDKITKSNRLEQLEELHDVVCTKHKLMNQIKQIGALPKDLQEDVQKIERFSITSKNAKEQLLLLFQELQNKLKKHRTLHADMLQQMESLYIELSQEHTAMDLLLHDNINELYNLYETTENIALQTTLQDILSDINMLYQSISGFEHFQEIEYIIQLMDSVFDIYQDDTITLSTKVQQLEERRTILFQQYYEYEAMHEQLVDQANRLHQMILANVTMREQLGKDIKAFDSEESLDNLILLVEQDNQLLIEEWHKLQETKRLQRSIKELLESRGYEHISSRQTSTRSGIQNQSYYIVDDGVILTVSTNTDGVISHYVTGMETPDNRTSSQDVIASQHKFCSDYDDIREVLAEEGYELDELQRLEPSEAVAYLEDFTSVFTLEELQTIEAYHQALEQHKRTEGRRRHE
jgi:hypothetical protein